MVICLNFISTAQNNFLLKGKIFDSETNSPIPFANIYIVSTSLGVISGEDGFFAFYIPENNRLDTLCISALGYEQFKIVCKDFKDNNDYKLLPKTYPLAEVV
ncbi:MAG TPA: carboxypeptidase-like regulatory domain-containing protein, partial [Tenuifilaceae bacterium]|nr:carboxypeptidase-like regulatory domain-containing protein [Tenuifilaceae bacterium]